LPALFTCHLSDEANPATCLTPAVKSTLLRQVAGWLIFISLDAYAALGQAPARCAIDCWVCDK
jgi:methenyltetrahydromethanopterin cyclohydrolase